MKNIFYIALLLFYVQSEVVQAQGKVMGINTEEPTRSVDVDGNVRITKGINKPNLNGVTHIVITDVDGNVDKMPVPAPPLPDRSVDVYSRVVILGGTNTPSNAQLADIKVDNFIFGISDDGVPTFRKASGVNSSFTYGVKFLDRRSHSSGLNRNNALEFGHSAGSGDGRAYFRNFTKSVGTTAVPIIDNINSGEFDSFEVTNQNTGESTPKKIPKNRTNTLRRRDNIRVHLVDPNKMNYFYKVTFMRQQNAGVPLGLQANGYSALVPDKDSWDVVGTPSQPDIWVITVERYNNEHNND